MIIDRIDYIVFLLSVLRFVVVRFVRRNWVTFSIDPLWRNADGGRGGNIGSTYSSSVSFDEFKVVFGVVSRYMEGARAVKEEGGG